MSFKEIGGYFELECGTHPQLHTQAHWLNSARNALRVAIHGLNIKKLWVPDFTCPVVYEALQAENCQAIFYQVGSDFLPQQFPPNEDFVLYTNYFGVCSTQVAYMNERYPKLLVDNAQAYYMPECGLASIYSPRKFFGLPDGGALYCRTAVEIPQERSLAFERCSHLLKRHDLGATAGYGDFRENSQKLGEEPPKLISRLTQMLMGNINYDKIRSIRLGNFDFLHKNLKSRNSLSFELSDNDVPMVYPFMVANDNLRKKLIEKKIYVATYWPELKDNPFPNLLPLPIDQRYNVDDMKYILQVINE